MKRKLFSTLAIFLFLALAVVAAVPESRVHAANPRTGIWSKTGSMSIARTDHTATLLPNGKVLVTGGDNSGSAELYTPKTGTWSSTGSLSTARYSHTATLLPNGKVLVAGGNSNSATLATAELFSLQR